MTKLSVFLLIAAIIALIAAVSAIIYTQKQKKKIRELTLSINSFLQSEKTTDFSFNDNDLAFLQNSILDLEQNLLREKENTQISVKRNAEFIADISHQLKTPLAGLRLYCEMQHSKEPTPHTEKQMQLIEKMEKLIFSLLRLEKIRSDAYVMNFEEQNLNELFDEIIRDMKHLFPGKKFILNVSENKSFRCDRSWISEAFGNVIKNACEHTKENGVIQIGAAEENQVLTVWVEDDGGGAKQEELPLLFTRFHRTENASPDSAGIGLAITNAIVEKHHGTASAVNAANGLRVDMCFPLTDCALKI